MKVNQISLKERISRISSGYPSDPDFVVSAIESMAQIPLYTYLNGFDKQRDRLRLLLGIRKGKEKEATYQDAAYRIYLMYLLPEAFQRKTGILESPAELQKMAHEAVDILALPLQKCYEERKLRYGT